MAHALADTGARILIARARRLRAAGRRTTGDPAAVWKDLRYRTDRDAGSTSDGADVPAVHALLRRRQHQVLGQRAVPAAARGLRRRRARSTASRRPGRSTTTRWRRTTIAPSGCIDVHGEARRRSDRAAARPVSVSAGAARAGHGGASSSSCARRACTRRRCRSGCCVPARRRLPAVQHLQLVPVQAPREERRRRLLRAAGACSTPNVDAVDRRAARAACSPTRPAGSVRGRRGRARRRASTRCRRRSSSCRAAPSTPRRCCCARRPTRTPTAWRIRRAWSAAATWRTWRR